MLMFSEAVWRATSGMLQKRAWCGWYKQTLTRVAAISSDGRVGAIMHRSRVHCK